MKFAKHLAKAMNVSDPEWFPYWINYKHLKKFLKLSLAWNRITEVTRASSSPTSKRPGGVIEGSPSMENREEHKKQLEKRQDGQQAKVSGKERPWKRLRERYGNTEPAAPPKIVRCSLTSDVSGHRSNGVANTKSGFPAKTSPLPRPNASIGASSSADGNVRRAKLSVPCAGTPHEGDEDECPFFGALLREVDKCSTFFLENEEDLKVRVQRLQLALHKLKDPVLSRLSSVKDCHVKLMQVHHVRPYLMGHGQIGKGWEQVASDLSTLRPFAAAGGIKADSCQQKYVSMRKEHREKVAKGDWVSGRRDGESEVVHSFLDACMCEEQAMQEIRNIKRDDSAEREEEQEEEKEARAEKLLEASLAPAGSRFRICGEYESRGSSGKKRTTSSSSSYPSMEGIMAGYLASMSSSPDTKRRRKEIEASDAAARQQQTENRREEIAVRRLEVELRQSRAEGDPRNPKANPRISRETYG